MTGKNHSEVYLLSPLPFQGQKRAFVKQFREALTECVSAKPIHTVVDLFGGSGLLSHTAKRMYPGLNVIYNDYDDFHVRIENIPRTNEIFARIRPILKGIPDKARLSDKLKGEILKVIREYDEAGFVDYITLSTSLLFPSHYVTNCTELEKESFYNRVRQTPVCADGYLDGLVIVKHDYFKLFSRYKHDLGVLFLVDPPYLSTDVKSYRSAEYWRLRDYMNVLLVLKSNYIFFTSEKSRLVDLCEWLADNPDFENPFRNAVLKTTRNQVNYSASYQDMMLYNIGK